MRRFVALTTRPVGERAVEVGRVEVGQPIPQRDVDRRRLLALDGDDPMDGIDHVEPLASEQQLAAERGAVELPRGQGGHDGILTVGADESLRVL